MDRVPFITAASFARRSSIPAIRLCGFLASCLLCVHSLAYIVRPGHSMFRVLHNIADLVLFLLVGSSGIVAEVFPRDSPTHRILKSNFPFFNSLIGRGFFYVVFGFIVMGNYSATSTTASSSGSSSDIPFCRMLGTIFQSSSDGTDPSDDSPVNFWGYFCVVSGFYMASVGFVLVYNSMKNQRTLFVPNSQQTTELTTSPMTTPFIPSMIVTNVASPGYHPAAGTSPPRINHRPEQASTHISEENDNSQVPQTFPIAV